MRIEREYRPSSDKQTHIETLAVLPEETGSYDTDVGEISIKICPVNERQNSQKVIFEGKIMEEGRNGSSSLRRVVKFPRSNKGIRQDISPDETLIFTRDIRQGAR